MMLKDDFVNELAPMIQLNKAETKSILENLLSIITEYMTSGSRLELRGFGTFHAAKRKSKPARVITTGEVIRVPERYVPKFIVGTILKKEVELAGERNTSSPEQSEVPVSENENNPSGGDNTASEI